VVDLYGEAVAIAATPAEFVASIEAALAGPNLARRTVGNRLVRRQDWDCIAERMLALIRGEPALPPPVDESLFLAT
jgi:hypothetical protein